MMSGTPCWGAGTIAHRYPEVTAPKLPGDLRLPSVNPSGCLVPSESSPPPDRFCSQTAHVCLARLKTRGPKDASGQIMHEKDTQNQNGGGGGNGIPGHGCISTAHRARQLSCLLVEAAVAATCAANDQPFVNERSSHVDTYTRYRSSRTRQSIRGADRAAGSRSRERS